MSAEMNLQVGVPRGLRVHASLRVAGQVRQNGKEVKMPVKIYSMKVEPGARVKKAKELFRQQSHPDELDWYEQHKRLEQQAPMQQLHVLVPEPPMENALDRSSFRRERRKKFGECRQFPALVNCTLLPSYNSSGASLMALDHKERIVLPTVSGNCKRQIKKLEVIQSAKMAWRNGNALEAQRLISNRTPLLCEGPFELERIITFHEYPAERDRAKDDALHLPPIHVQASNDATKEALETEIAVNRERGRENIEAERAFYDAKRDAFIRARDAERLRWGGASPFEAARCRRQARTESPPKEEEEEVAEEIESPICKSLAFGFARHKQSAFEAAEHQ
jgi:hypothetical protein